MLAAGCQAWAGADELGGHGTDRGAAAPAAPAQAAPRGSRQRFLAARPDVFVGIDAPEFNLTLERGLKSAGIRTVQYVSPQVWAWRQGRVRTIGARGATWCCACCRSRPISTPPTACAPSSSAIRWPMRSRWSRTAPRRGAPCSCPRQGVLVALLPGSRMSEVSRLAPPFVAAARHIQGLQPGWGFVAPMASAATREAFAREIAQLPGAPAIHVIDGQAQAALAAADGVIVASGTATLETLLTGRPMVVAYKTSALTAFLLRTVGLVKVRYFSQPNLLAGRGVVPEFFQEQVTRGGAGGCTASGAVGRYARGTTARANSPPSTARCAAAGRRARPMRC